MQHTMQRTATARDDGVNLRDLVFVEQFCAVLKSQGLLDAASELRARRAQQQSGERFDLVLVRLGLINDSTLADALASFSGYRRYFEHQFPDQPLFPDKLRLPFLKSNHVLPVGLNGGVLQLALADPFNLEVQSALSFMLDCRIECGVAAEGEIDRGIDRLYGRPQAGDVSGVAIAARDDVTDADDDARRLEDMASEAPIIKLVRTLIVQAVEAHSSDIHIEPLEDSLQVRFRVDGILQLAGTYPSSMRPAICSRIKIMARLNIAERRLPQDGRIKENVRGREIDLRVSTMPTMWGESIVMRILDRSSVELDFAKLGIVGAPYREFDRLLREPNGVILVTGPTGSGKTTTLYTALRALNTSERKIFTVEDPIEYHLPGINQIQVQPKIGLTFAHALRSILRHDPDIIMVGEIRDLETAQIAIQAALTGHLVLSTVHTNSAAATVTRLLDMGVEKYLLGSCLKAVLAQRLVRKLCDQCASPTDVSPILKQLIDGLQENVGALPPSPRLAAGCSACQKKGYSGRTTVFELLRMTDGVRTAMMSSQSDQMIETAAIHDGMQTMLENGLSKILQGETTLEEVLRVTRFDKCQDTTIKPTISTEH